MSARLGHVAIIDHNPRSGEKKEFAPAQAIRYHQRSSAERVNSHLHDNHGGRHIRCAARPRWRHTCPSGCWSSPPSN